MSNSLKFKFEKDEHTPIDIKYLEDSFKVMLDYRTMKLKHDPRHN